VADDEEYIEVDAVVRMPRGERLADSKRTAGWSRGFTPKSTDKGPEHVEIRLKVEGEDDQLEPEPRVVHTYDYIEPQQPREQSWVDQLAAELLRQAINDLVEAAKPHVVRWRDTKLIPVVKAKRDDLALKRQARKAKKANREANTVPRVAEPGAGDEAPGREVATTVPGPDITMSSEQYQQLVLALLAVDEFRDMLLRVVDSAHVNDSEPAAQAELQRLMELPPQRRSELVEILSGNPSIIEDLGRLLTAGGRVELGEPVRRREQA
jgi:hypothetical protein